MQLSVVLACVLVNTSGGLLFGILAVGVTTSLTTLYPCRYNLDLASVGDTWKYGTVIAGPLIGATIFSTITARVVGWFGPVRSIAFGAFFGLTTLWSAFASTYTEQLLARIITGGALGITSTTCTSYVIQIAPPQHRGTLGSLYALSLTFGNIIANAVNYGVLGVHRDLSPELYTERIADNLEDAQSICALKLRFLFCLWTFVPVLLFLITIFPWLPHPTGSSPSSKQIQPMVDNERCDPRQGLHMTKGVKLASTDRAEASISSPRHTVAKNATHSHNESGPIVSNPCAPFHNIMEGGAQDTTPPAEREEAECCHTPITKEAGTSPLWVRRELHPYVTAEAPPEALGDDEMNDSEIGSVQSSECSPEGIPKDEMDANLIRYLLAASRDSSILDSEEGVERYQASIHKFMELDQVSFRNFVTTYLFLFPRTVFLNLVQAVALQLTGISPISSYTYTIFAQAGFSEVVLATIFLAVWNFITALISTVMSDRVGRRRMWIGGLVLLTIPTAILAPLSAHSERNPSVVGPISIVLLGIYLLGFQVGPGNLFWITSNELIPNCIGPQAFAFANTLQWLLATVISLIYPVAQAALGPYALLIFTFFAFATLVVHVLYAPETRWMEKEAIVKEMMKSRWRVC